MNELDTCIVERSNECAILKRFIDDYFVSLLSQHLTGEKLLTMANELNDNIKFTLELPNNNQLPFLDTMVSFDREIKHFSTALYIKPIHSLCITPWDSHGSRGAGISIIGGGQIFIYSCSAQLISFEIDCFYSL